MKIDAKESYGQVARRFVRDDSGQDLIEYAIVAALVGLAAVATIKGLTTKIAAAFTNIGSTLTTNT